MGWLSNVKHSLKRWTAEKNRSAQDHTNLKALCRECHNKKKPVFYVRHQSDYGKIKKNDKDDEILYLYLT